MSAYGGMRCSQINSPVFASSAWITFAVFVRNMVPPCTSGVGSFAPPSCMVHTHASCSSFTESRAIDASGL